MDETMTDALAVVQVSAELGELESLVESARGYAAESLAANTRAAYEADWKTFAAWCALNGLACRPAPPAVVATYLAHLADQGRRVSTIERALAGIAHAHRSAGYTFARSDLPIPDVLAGIRRRLGVAPSKKKPLDDHDLRALVGTLGVDLIGLRDRALLTLGWFTAGRRSEIVGLRVEDVAFVREGIRLTLRRSKTDQEGRGIEKGVPYAGDPAACPVRALRAWLDAARLEKGPIFCAVLGKGEIAERALHAQEVARIVKRGAERVGLDPESFGGHSLRAGFITTAARKGKSLDAIMRQSGHRSERVARGYIQHATLFDDNAAAGLL
jgi:integrase